MKIERRSPFWFILRLNSRKTEIQKSKHNCETEPPISEALNTNLFANHNLSQFFVLKYFCAQREIHRFSRSFEASGQRFRSMGSYVIVQNRLFVRQIRCTVCKIVQKWAFFEKKIPPRISSHFFFRKSDHFSPFYYTVRWVYLYHRHITCLLI